MELISDYDIRIVHRDFITKFFCSMLSKGTQPFDFLKSVGSILHERIFMKNFTHTYHSFYTLLSLTLKNIERTTL